MNAVRLPTDGGSDLPEGAGESPRPQLQAIVEEASRVIGRPVAVDDKQLRLLAYTEHSDEEVDAYRLISIMKRQHPREIIDWLDRHDLWSSDEPLRIPKHPVLDYNSRVAAPVRCQGLHFGWLWCIDRDETLSDLDLRQMAAFADDVGVQLYRETLLMDLTRSRERELLRDLISTDPYTRKEAAHRLGELELFTSSGDVVALVIPLEYGQDESDPKIAVEAALMRIRRRLAPKRSLHLVKPDHAVLLVSLADPGLRAAGLGAIAARLRDELLAAPGIGTEGRRQVVAVGGVADCIFEARTSYEQALRARDVTMAVPTFGDVVRWDELGVYQLLAEITEDAPGPRLLHVGLRRLLDDPRAGELLPTLERYLDLAGDVQQTSASLFLHRSTLYKRLRRVESVAAIDLRRGDDRLALHLSLKLARLQGVLPPAS